MKVKSTPITTTIAKGRSIKGINVVNLIHETEGLTASYSCMTIAYQRRWAVETYHRSLKNTAFDELNTIKYGVQLDLDF